MLLKLAIIRTTLESNVACKTAVGSQRCKIALRKKKSDLSSEVYSILVYKDVSLSLSLSLSAAAVHGIWDGVVTAS